MSPVIISCRESDWKNVVATNLRDGVEVDLTNLDDADADDCEKLGKANSMEFAYKPETKFGSFRKKKR